MVDTRVATIDSRNIRGRHITNLMQMIEGPGTERWAYTEHRTVHAYAHLIQQHVDDMIDLRPAELGDRNFIAVLPESIMALWPRPHGPTSAQNRRALDDLGVKPGDLPLLDFIFAPYYEPDQNHWVLIGAAPSRRYVFIIDSCHAEDLYEEQLGHLRRLLHREIGAWTANWPLLRPRVADVPAYRLWPRQRDWRSCAIFMLTNMFNLTMGYRLRCYEEADLRYKRYRMAGELINGGFSPPDWYRLRPLPFRLTEFLDTTGRPAFHAHDAWPASLGATTGEEKTMCTADLFHAIRKDPKQAEWLRRQRIIASRTKFDKSIGGFPAEFDEEYFVMQPFVNASLPHEVFSHLKSKAELLAFCEANGIDCSHFADDEEGLRAWMENQAGGTWSSAIVEKAKVSGASSGQRVKGVAEADFMTARQPAKAMVSRKSAKEAIPILGGMSSSKPVKPAPGPGGVKVPKRSAATQDLPDLGATSSDRPVRPAPGPASVRQPRKSALEQAFLELGALSSERPVKPAPGPSTVRQPRRSPLKRGADAEIPDLGSTKRGRDDEDGASPVRKKNSKDEVVVPTRTLPARTPRKRAEQ